MEVSVENTSSLGRRLKISVPKSKVNEKIQARMDKLSKEVRLKGFRPGKVPKTVIDKRFGKSVRVEVIDELVRTTLTDAVKDKDLTPAVTPKIEDLKDETDQDLEYVATFEVIPKIELADFSTLSVEIRKAEATEADIDTAISTLKDEHSDWEVVDRKSKNNDKVVVDFTRELQVEDSKKEEEKNITIRLGGKGVLPGLDKVLIGKKAKDEVETELKYPDDWPDKKVCGKPVKLWITINEVKEMKPIDDEKLAELLQIKDKDLAKLRETVKEKLINETDDFLKAEKQEKLLEAVLEANDFELPNSLLEQEKQAMINEQKQRGNEEDTDSEEFNKSAFRRVKLGLLLNEYIGKKDIKVNQKDIIAEIDKLAVNFPDPNKLKEIYYSNEQLLQSVQRKVLLDKAVDAMLEEVKITTKTASIEELREESS